jgi:nucleoside-diphosphate-sugar epimerase
MRDRTISVLGCGWLGLPLAEKLTKDGYAVKGSTTTPAKYNLLASRGITPFLLSFPVNWPKPEVQEFLASDILVFNIPPSKTPSADGGYEAFIKAVLEAAPSALQRILFVSSTSVYPDLNREVVENDALSAAESPSLLLRCEHLVQQHPTGQSTTVRFGGLMGDQRHPGRWLAGKTNVPQPQAPVNMIHLSDCVGILSEIIRQEKWGFTFNACAPEHPSREEFYTSAAYQLGWEPPSFKAEDQLSFKHISPAFLQNKLQYTFQHPDPVSCLTSPDF